MDWRDTRPASAGESRGWHLDPPDDDTAWQLDVVTDPGPGFPIPTTDGWTSDAPAALDLGHDDTALLYATGSGVTGCTFGDIDWKAAQHSVQMGYTILSVCEKRAVIVDGQVARIWPRTHDAEPDHRERFRVLIPDPAGHFDLDLGHPLWSALTTAERLSRRMGGASMALVRTLAVVDWH